MPDLETGRGSSLVLRSAYSNTRGHAGLALALLGLLLPVFIVAHVLFSPLHFLCEPILPSVQAPTAGHGQPLPLEGARTDAPLAGGASALALERWQDDRIYFIGSREWTERSRASVAEALTLLPVSVRGALGNPALGPLYLSVDRHGKTSSGRQPYGRAANFYSTNEGRNEIVLFPDQTARTVLHELGHAYNLRHAEPGSYAQVYSEPEMQSFLAASGWRLLTPPAALRNMRDHAEVKVVYEGPLVWTRVSRDDPLEDFANSFAAYFAAPGELKTLSPARFEWFEARFGAR